MGQGASGNIILTGFSYTGKSVVAEKVAQRLGWDFVDTDEEIVRLAGKAIPEIFAENGEGTFREMERRVLREACRRQRVVIATGGGAILDRGNREVMARSGVVICLEARPETIYRRLLADAKRTENPVVRPLLSGEDPLGRITSLKGFRQPYYDLADWKVATDDLGLEEVCERVVEGWRRAPRGLKGDLATAREADCPYCEGAACVVTTATASYPIFVGWGLLGDLGERMRGVGLAGAAFVIADETVFSLYGPRVERTLADAGFASASFTVPPGETTKSLDSAARIYDWLVERRAERRDTIVALGGGMVGDLAGFVAATFLRGLPLVQVSTSLVGMVDAAIGGKVAVNHPQGKNLIGAFYQPRLVLAATETLTTLPRRELVSGWTEVVKHATILDPGLFQFLEERAERLLELEREATTEAVVRSVRIKAGVVASDEREEGRRTILNYGHTIAHALEAATGYGRFLHGEAVSVGMVGAALLSERLGLLSGEEVRRQRDLLLRFGLPISCADVSLESLLGAMELDKKVRGKEVRWVLSTGMGKTEIREEVPREDLLAVLYTLLEKDKT